VGEAVSSTPFFLRIDDPSLVAESRRLATVVAQREGLPQNRIANIAIIVSELASNLLKHAQGGELHIAPLSGRGEAGVEILSIDRGPGISHVSECLNDGHSTTGTSGTGLGAVRRLSDEFDIFSQPGKGTIIVSQIRMTPAARGLRIEIGLASRPVTGETVSGDAWAVRNGDDSALILVADGLGHGALAADASRAAVDAFNRSAEESPGILVQVLHRALHGTRGAAVAIASVDFSLGRVRFAGLGNIAGVIVGSSKLQAMVSHNGTAGYEMRQIKEYVYPWTEGSALVMHSDGLSTHWTAAAVPSFNRQHPSVMAAFLYREAGRERDDACIIVARG
jgi:anti-sigma regulatory factor (Ser/Thr protein kinase)